MEQRLVVIAEQVGRIVGTVQTKAEGWFDRKALSDQFASVRDKAAEMVAYLAGGEQAAKAAVASPRNFAGSSTSGRSGSVVDAPGKKHRKPVPSTPGTKHSDTRIAKMKVVKESRRRGGR